MIVISKIFGNWTVYVFAECVNVHKRSKRIQTVRYYHLTNNMKAQSYATALTAQQRKRWGLTAYDYLRVHYFVGRDSKPFFDTDPL